MHFMNPQRRAHMAAPGAPAAAVAAPGAEGELGPELTVTLTKSADGTITCDTGDGNPQRYATVERALEAAKMILEGGEEEPGGEAMREEGAIPGAGEGGQ